MGLGTWTRGSLLILAVTPLVAILTASPVQAGYCETCVAHLICNYYDECIYVEECKLVQLRGTEQCWVDFYGCHQAGAGCRWAELMSPANGASLSSRLLAGLCSEAEPSPPLPAVGDPRSAPRPALERPGEEPEGAG